MKLNMKKAFTLVEMLIVVIIIGILMAALLPRLKGAQERARDTARKANLSQISTALEMYFNDNGIYPSGKCANDLKSELVPQYLSSIPTDPQKSRVTYGTANGGCKNGNYGYAVLYRNGAESWGSVLVANVEAEGRVGNFILPDSTTNITFDPSKTDNKRMSTNNVDADTTSVGTKLANDDHFKDADVAENAICKTTKVDGANDPVGCWWPASKIDWSAKKNPAMVYVRFN